MKRLLVTSLITAGLLCSATALYALAPGQLFKIPTANIGDKIKTVTGPAAVPTICAFKSDSTYQVVGNLLTIPLYAYNPMLGAAASFAVGYSFDSQYDLKKAYDENWLQQFPSLDALIKDLFLPDIPISSPGSVASHLGLNWKQTTGWSHIEYRTPLNFIYFQDFGSTGYKIQGPPIGDTQAVYRMNLQNPHPANPSIFSVEYSLWQLTAEEPNFPGQPIPTFPDHLTDEQAEQLAQHIVESLTSNPAIKEALNDIAKQHPDVVRSPNPITQQDITNWANTNNYNLNQQYIDYLTTIYNSTTGDFHTQIGVELEKAKTEAEKEEAEKLKEETFSPISDNPFTEPYNPGEYDIPARFTTFLNRVKSTGLFSFSADFFNSLPGGGSPIYEIEAGQYGHHTIDLSQTLTVGLAVLKTILLACFGFLSIRAVIMKR